MFCCVMFVFGCDTVKRSAHLSAAAEASKTCKHNAGAAFMKILCEGNAAHAITSVILKRVLVLQPLHQNMHRRLHVQHIKHALCCSRRLPVSSQTSRHRTGGPSLWSSPPCSRRHTRAAHAHSASVHTVPVCMVEQAGSLVR